jgi:hypothetical protein
MTFHEYSSRPFARTLWLAVPDQFGTANTPARFTRGICRVPVRFFIRRPLGPPTEASKVSFEPSYLVVRVRNWRSARFSRGFCRVPSACLEAMKDSAQRRSQQGHRRPAIWGWDCCRARRPGGGSRRCIWPGLFVFLGGEVRDPPNRLSAATPLSPTPGARSGAARGACRWTRPKRDWLSSNSQVIEVARGTDGK